MRSDCAMIYKGTKDLGNAFYADWVTGNLKDIAVWHNDQKKGDVVEALLGLTWVQSNCRNMNWAGDIICMQAKLEKSLTEWERYWEQTQKQGCRQSSQRSSHMPLPQKKRSKRKTKRQRRGWQRTNKEERNISTMKKGGKNEKGTKDHKTVLDHDLQKYLV